MSGAAGMHTLLSGRFLLTLEIKFFHMLFFSMGTDTLIHTGLFCGGKQIDGDPSERNHLTDPVRKPENAGPAVRNLLFRR